MSDPLERQAPPQGPALDDLPDFEPHDDSTRAAVEIDFEEPQHLSIVFVAVRTSRLLFTAVIPILLAGILPILAAGDAPLYVLLPILAVVAILAVVVTIGWGYLSWKRFTFQLSDTELRIDRGVVFRQTAHIPFDRIHSVDHSAGLLERVLGVVTLNVQTAGVSAKAEGVIEGLTLDVAEALQREIFRRVRGGGSTEAPTAAEEVATDGAAPRPDIARSVSELSSSVRGVLGGVGEDAPVTFEYHLPTKNLILAAISSTQSFVAIIVFIAAGAQFLEMFQLYDVLFDNVGAAVRDLPVLEGLLFIVAALILTWMFSVVNTTLKFGGFTVRRRGPRVEVDRGLLERKVAGIPIERIQSVRVNSGIIRRFLKYAEIELDVAGGLGKGESTAEVPVNIVHPFIALAAVDAFLTAIVPEIDDVPTEIERLPRRVMGRYLIRWFLVALPIAALPAAVWWFASQYVIAAIIVALLVIALFLVIGRQSFLSRGWATSARTLVVTGGVTDRNTMIVPKRRIQWARVSQTPFQRMARLATLTITTAAAPVASVRDMPVDVALEIQRWAIPRSDEGVSSTATQSPPPAKGS